MVRLALLLTLCAAVVSAQSNCPTGANCGVASAFCQSYVPPSTGGATDLLTLSTGYGGAILITSPGNYFLSANTSKTKSGIAILTTSGSVDINLNGKTLTYGTTADGTGSTQIGEYGILMCNTGNLSSEGLDSSYSTNGLCRSGGLSSNNVTVENGTIIQSTGASGFFNTNTCPGSGTSCSTAQEFPTTYSHVILSPFSSGDTFKQLTLTWQNVSSNGIVVSNRRSGTGYDIECNTLNDKVTQLNVRASGVGHAAIYTTSDAAANTGSVIKYNTIVGSPQNGIEVGAGSFDPAATVIQNNDIDIGFYQCTTPPCTNSSSGLEMYTNDYALGACVQGGDVSFNYVHNVNGRGMTCIKADSTGADLKQTNFHNNYIVSSEVAVNGEYGPNGQTANSTWIGGCEINGARGVEFKQAYNLNMYSNTFIVQLNGATSCAGAGIDYTNYGSGFEPSTAPNPISEHDNIIQMQNLTGGTAGNSGGTGFGPQPFACWIFNSAAGNYGGGSPFFSTFKNESCTSDGNFAHSVGFDPGDFFTWSTPTFALGSHQLATFCGEDSGSPANQNCLELIHWTGQRASIVPDELGYVWTDLTLSNSACPSLPLCMVTSGTVVARGGTVQYTQTVFARGASNGWFINGATVQYTDAQSGTHTCTTGGTGSCSVVVPDLLRGSTAGNSLTTTNYNTQTLAVSFGGCTTNTQSGLSITSTATTTVTLAGCSGNIPPNAILNAPAVLFSGTLNASGTQAGVQ